MSKPRIPITDRRFRYRNSAETDVKKTWAPFLRLLRRKSNVVPIKKQAK